MRNLLLRFGVWLIKRFGVQKGKNYTIIYTVKSEVREHPTGPTARDRAIKAYNDPMRSMSNQNARVEQAILRFKGEDPPRCASGGEIISTHVINKQGSN